MIVCLSKHNDCSKLFVNKQNYYKTATIWHRLGDHYYICKCDFYPIGCPGSFHPLPHHTHRIYFNHPPSNMSTYHPPLQKFTCKLYSPKLEIVIFVIMTWIKMTIFNSIDIWIYKLLLTYLLLIGPRNIFKLINII